MSGAIRMLVVAALAASLSSRAPARESAADRLAAAVAALGDYTVTLDAHEVLGDRSQDYRFRYTRANGVARLEVLEGPGTGATLATQGDGRVTATRRGVPLLRARGGVRDPAFTTLRGNGIEGADLAALARCLGARGNRLKESSGPQIAGEPTRALALRAPACPADPPADRAVTLDLLDISERTGLPVLRRRFVGREIVERWALHDYRRLR